MSGSRSKMLDIILPLHCELKFIPRYSLKRLYFHAVQWESHIPKPLYIIFLRWKYIPYQLITNTFKVALTLCGPNWSVILDLEESCYQGAVIWLWIALSIISHLFVFACTLPLVCSDMIWHQPNKHTLVKSI